MINSTNKKLYITECFTHFRVLSLLLAAKLTISIELCKKKKNLFFLVEVFL